MNSFRPTHVFRGLPVALVDEGWSAQEVPMCDGIELPVGVYSAIDWLEERWPQVRATRDGRLVEWTAIGPEWLSEELTPLLNG